MHSSERPTDPNAPTLPPTAPAEPDPRFAATVAPAETPPDFATVAQPTGSAPAPARGPGLAPPGFTIERELGRGGMGVVYLARQHGLNRPVALKMVLSGAHAHADELVRFLQEAESVAQLRHPNVVQVFEVGSHEGRPFMALEYCDGGGLDRKFAGQPVPPAEAAALLAPLARAVHAAHAAGIVHRDLKPQNILLAADGTPKVTDFGLAKRAGSGSDLTASGAILGTPSYMAPEQAEGKGKSVGPAADVYALGAILYEALTGRPPFRAATPLDTVLQVVSEEPAPPRRLNPQVPADLETIALKCLAKDPARRYSTAAALADDLERWQAGMPISARPVGRLERAWKWARRNKAVAGGLAGTAAALVLGIALASWQAIRASAEARRADWQAGEATREAERAEANAAEARHQAGIARDEKELARQEEQRARQALADLKAERGQSAGYRYATQVNWAHAEWQALNPNNARRILAGCAPNLRGWEWAFLDRLIEQSNVPLHGHGNMLLAAALSADGARAYTIALDNTLRVWDARTGAELRALNYQGHQLAASPDGKRLAVAAGRTVNLYDAEAARGLGQIVVDDLPCGLAYARGGRDLIVVTVDGGVTVRDPETGAERSRAKARLNLDRGARPLLNIGQAVAISADGRLIAQGGLDGKVRVWDAATGQPQFEGPKAPHLVGTPAFSPDGKLVAVPSADGTIRLWDVAGRRAVQTLRGHRSAVWAVAFSPDGKQLASASKDLTARIWDPATGELLLTFAGHGGEVRAVRYSADGTRLITASPDGTARVWDPADRVVVSDHVRQASARESMPLYTRAGSPEHLTFYGHLAPVVTIACSDDGRLIATSAARDVKSDDQVVVWDVDARREVMRLPAPLAIGHFLKFMPGGKRLLVASAPAADKPCRVTAYDAPAGTTAWAWDGPAAEEAYPAVSPDGRRVAVVARSAKSRLVLLDPATGRPTRQVELNFSATEPGFIDDRQVAVADSTTGVVRVYDADTGAAGREWPTGTARVSTLAAGPGGRIATADLQAAIKVWDGQTGKLLETLEGHAGQVMQMVFGPDGRLASVATDFTARVWNTNTGLELLSFPGHPDVPIGVAWSQDGNRLATVCQDGGLRVWQGPTADTASAADSWPVVFADEFDRAAPGGKWKTLAGTWDVHDGALRGHLTPSTIPGAAFNIAMANLAGVDLPNRADVRFKFRASRSMAVSVNLADRTGNRQVYSPIVAGACAMAGSPITMLLQVNFPAGKADQLKTAAIGTGTKVPMDGGRWYACRVLREPERLRMWVDGSEVLTARIPDVDLPRLNLQGAWAGTEDTIEFDDLQVRFPADAAREMALRFEAADLFKEIGVRAEVRRRLAEKAKDHPGDLAAIDRALGGLAEDPAALEEKSWAVVSRAGNKPEEYRLALARAEAAVRHTPDDPELLGTLGLAQVRAGDAKAAVASLTKTIDRARDEYGAAWPSHHAALALAYHQLGDRANAKAEALRLWSVMLSDRWANDGVAKLLTGEVEEALGADARPDAAAAGLIQQVLRHERDGWLRHDLPAYLKMWADDGVERYGRGPEADAHDETRSRQQIEAVRRIAFRFPTDPAVHTSLEEASATIAGDRAEVRCRWTTQNGNFFETLGARYRLVRAASEWRIAEARSWPLVRSRAGEREVFTPAEWAARDKAADALAQSPDTVARVTALKKASRTAEAERVAREALRGDKADPALLALHGELAFALGDVPAALAAFDRAERLDPDVELPWYMTRARVAFRGHGREMAGAAAYFPTGDRVASAGGDGTIRLWDPNTGTESKRIDAGEPLAGIAVSVDGTRMAASGKDVHIYDAATGRPVAVGRGHSATVYRLNFSRDGKRIVSASGDGTARVWDAASGKQLASFAGHGKPVWGAEFTPDGKRVVSCGSDNLARLWDAETGKEIRTFEGHTGAIKRATLSPKGDRLATVAADRTVKIWDVETGKPLRTLTDHTQIVDGAAWSADGKRLATGDWAGETRVWDAETGAKRFTLRGYPGEVYVVAFRPDGQSLLVAGSGPAIIYDLGPLAAKP